MLGILGWLVAVGVGLFISLAAIVGAVLGGWVTGVTIGGAYPPFSERFLGFIIIAGVLAYWYGVWTLCPFTVAID